MRTFPFPLGQHWANRSDACSKISRLDYDPLGKKHDQTSRQVTTRGRRLTRATTRTPVSILSSHRHYCTSTTTKTTPAASRRPQPLPESRPQVHNNDHTNTTEQLMDFKTWDSESNRSTKTPTKDDNARTGTRTATRISDEATTRATRTRSRGGDSRARAPRLC